MCPAIYQVVDGFKFPNYQIRENIEFALKYQHKSGDKFLISYPKCGTTWTQHIINLIVNNGVPDPNNQTFMREAYFEDNGENSKNYPIVKTHIPREGLSISNEAKYMMVFRNPKDCCVSFYHHTTKIYTEFSGNFHDYFQLWMKGDVPYGDYFKHVLNYWNHRLDKNFHFLVYEQMKANPRDAVLKVAKFLGDDYSRELEDNELLVKEIIKKSSIDSMRNDLSVYKHYIRKGVVGDWRNHFTKEESDLVDHKIETVFGGTGLHKLWANYTKWENH